jgi:hypothetical protein
MTLFQSSKLFSFSAIARFGILQEYYRTMAQREKMEKDAR